VVPVVTVSPTKGSYSLINNKVHYTPNTDFKGKDSLTYSATCGGQVTTAKVYFTVVEYPDNIAEVKCWVDPEAQDWIINRSDSVGLVRTVTQFLVGDMNDDGFPDIVATHGPYVAGDANPRKDADKIKIFYGPEFTTVDSITGLAPESQSFGAIGKIKVSESPEVYETLIFYRDRLTLSLYALRPDGTSPWGNNPACVKGMIGLADFNGDGWTEVYVGNKIFDAATGKLLADGGSNNTGKAALVQNYSDYVSYSQAVDILGDPNLELIAGNQIYKVDIDRTVATAKTLEVISSVTPPSGAGNDGVTIVGDFNNDGKLEVLVRQRQNAALTGNTIHLYLWSPHTGTSTGTILARTTDNHQFFGIPFIGDIDGDGRIEVVTLGSNGQVANQLGFRARKYNAATGQFTDFWNITHIDQSGSTRMTLFDFNLDGIAEIVYRDEYQLRIINGSKKSHITGADTTAVYTLSSFKSYSETSFEYPVIVDIYGNGSSAILVTSDTGETRTSSAASANKYTGEAYIDIFTSDPITPWASARKVWNQYSYNPVNVNEDLTIPAIPSSIATVFPGKDGTLGTTDDVRPYNNILQQQTIINKSGVPFFIAPDIYPEASLVSSTVTGNSVFITIGIINKGDAAIGTPVYATLYKDDILAANKISTGSYDGYINPGDTGYVTVNIPDITSYLPLLHINIRVNDDGTNFPYQPECDETNNVFPLLNPAINLMMKKDAVLQIVPPVNHNGLYSNPVSVLYSEDVEYKITAINANEVTGTVIIRDTLPLYLDYKSSLPSVTPILTGSVPPREVLVWSIAGVGSMSTTSVTVTATPREGSCSSQPMFINRAWVTVSDSITVPTNDTYHQGASISVATFSSGLGGKIYNAAEQALDYRTTPRSGIVIVPDEGYRFTGWSHDDYVSLRGEAIAGQEGIMHYDTLTVYGHIELQANFELEAYPIRYYLNGGTDAHNPGIYTIKSAPITLKGPEKLNDVFLGWTGSNGNVPQETLTISSGTTGELAFYAN
jgi:uncharacterized repeat protein (TIGR02543 family)